MRMRVPFSTRTDSSEGQGHGVRFWLLRSLVKRNSELPYTWNYGATTAHVAALARLKPVTPTF